MEVNLAIKLLVLTLVMATVVLVFVVAGKLNTTFSKYMLIGGASWY
tara:strand:+ start:455 stop:592 length:138 start_codon:yes stop_codon:yes gene_type:complete